jgi:hypothetical protein
MTNARTSAMVTGEDTIHFGSMALAANASRISLGGSASSNHRLNERGQGETVVVFTHGFVMRVLLWLQQHTGWRITGAEVA